MVCESPDYRRPDGGLWPVASYCTAVANRRFRGEADSRGSFVRGFYELTPKLRVGELTPEA
jgi:hypothetical protein